MNRKKGIEAKKRGVIINKQGQTSEMKEEIGKIEEFEDVTKYGEFISSYFAWIEPEKQKEKAQKMEKMTDQGKSLPIDKKQKKMYNI